MVLLLSINEYLLVKPSCLTCQSNYHGRPSNKCLACIETTSHKTSSSYFPMWKDTNTYLVTLTSLLSLSHCNLWDRGCLIVVSPNFSTIVVLATLVQLLSSIIIIHTLFCMWHLVWKMFSHFTFSSSLTCILRTLLATNNSHWTVYSSSSMSSNDGIDSVSSSSSNSISPLSHNIIILLFGHWLVMWPLSWH